MCGLAWLDSVKESLRDRLAKVLAKGRKVNLADPQPPAAPRGVEPLEARCMLAINSASIGAGYSDEGSQRSFELYANTDFGVAGWYIDWGDGTSGEWFNGDPGYVQHTYADDNPSYTIRGTVYENADPSGSSSSGTWQETESYCPDPIRVPTPNSRLPAQNHSLFSAGNLPANSLRATLTSSTRRIGLC